MGAKSATRAEGLLIKDHLANHGMAPYDRSLHLLGEETQMVDLDELKSKFLNTEFASRDLQIDADNLLASATASGEARAEFIDPAHPDFQATPAYLCSISSGRHLPIDFPSLGGIPMDGGKAVERFAPVRAGIPLSVKAHLHDIYDKKGRSGRMIFIVVRTELFDEANTHLANIDSRMVVREKPAA
jgi:hypothetical protein